MCACVRVYVCACVRVRVCVCVCVCVRACLQVGTSSIVYPAAMFAPQVAARGVPVAEFNMEDTPATMNFR